jgi:hypothetical protein
MADLVKVIGSHNRLATPSLRAFDNEVMQPLHEKCMPPPASGNDAEERAPPFSRQSHPGTQVFVRRFYTLPGMADS